jgi:Chromate resistance exported protein
MKWVTREKVRVNRTATAWLIRRFIDPNAELIFVPQTKSRKFSANAAQPVSTLRVRLIRTKMRTGAVPLPRSSMSGFPTTLCSWNDAHRSGR